MSPNISPPSICRGHRHHNPTTRVGGRVLGPPLWKVHSCLSVELWRPGWGGGAVGSGTHDSYHLFHNLLQSFQAEAYEQVIRLYCRVLGMCLPPYSCLENWNKNIKRKGSILWKTEISKIVLKSRDLYFPEFRTLNHAEGRQMHLYNLYITIKFLLVWYLGPKTPPQAVYSMQATYGLNWCTNQQVSLVKMAS